MISLFITSKVGSVHGGDNLCAAGHQAVLLNRHKPVRMSQIVVYKLPGCTRCWTVSGWDAVMSGRKPT